MPKTRPRKIKAACASLVLLPAFASGVAAQTRRRGVAVPVLCCGLE
ncbi:MAG: hypothetical protein ABW208_01860 [Pyrinomonadaceae bacterium]